MASQNNTNVAPNPADTTTQLSNGPGLGLGDFMDESAIFDGDGSNGTTNTLVAKRERVVIGGELNRNIIVEPVPNGGAYALPVTDVELRQLMGDILLVLQDIRTALVLK